MDLLNKTKKNDQAIKEIFSTIATTNASTQKIQTAVEMINAIAEQTNLLALNAAIEAARAAIEMRRTIERFRN